MTPINKFKSEIGEDFYVERVAHYAADKNIAGAVSVLVQSIVDKFWKVLLLISHKWHLDRRNVAVGYACMLKDSNTHRKV